MQVQAQQTIADSVLKNTYLLIEALKDNYRQYAIRSHKRSVEKGDNAQYHIACIQKLRDGHSDIDYVIETGKKYHKVIMVSTGNSRSVHCFIDKKTGEVYKSSSWKAPAKGVRFDLRLIKDREWIYANADWAGGWLYKR
jgi:DNA polymerase/3'-5' exonuclease PolX